MFVMAKLLRWLKRSFDFTLVQSEFRKLGINFITAGLVGIFFTNPANLKFPLSFGALMIILIGICALLCGLFKGRVRNE